MTTSCSVPIPAGLHRRSRIATLLIASAVIALVGCGSSTSDVDADNNVRTTGNPAVYQRIETSTSCVDLQREFDIAMDNAEARNPGDSHRDLSLSYARAADNRMDELGCYG